MKNYFKIIWSGIDYFFFFYDDDLDDIKAAYRRAEQLKISLEGMHPGTRPQLSVYRSIGDKILPSPAVIGVFFDNEFSVN